MIIRIVKLQLKPDAMPSFLANFEVIKERIRNFPGNQKLVLYQDVADSCIFFTYSFWDSEAALNAYRQSDFFDAVWSETKLMFAGKPEAWSVNQITEVFV
ncbi:putative quinol monooxygenase [Flavobacterium sp.]|uniref:putative quinol monooxygenase n=1 Tax=Flavobacterium sp. TaxID=239 RepID=UPI003B9A8868